MSIKRIKLQLLAISFTQGFFIWYAIDKLFFLEQGVTMQQIIIIGILAWIPQILFEIPSSILADRWSRKGVLVIGGMGMFASTLLLGLGSNFLAFAIGYTIWAFGSAMLSGTYDALVYDIMKSRGKEKDYKKLQGQLRSIFLASMASSGIVALFVAHSYDLRYAFFLCLPVILLNIFLILSVSEPPMSQIAHRSLNWIFHIKDALTIIKSDVLRWLAFLFIALIGLRSVMYEYYQLVAIDKQMSTENITILFTIIVGVMSGVAYLFSRIMLTRSVIYTAWILLFVSSTVGFILDGFILATINLLILLGCIEFFNLYFQLCVQHHIDSSKRATILSSLLAFGQILFFVLACIMLFTLTNYGIGIAITISALPLLVLGLFEIRKLEPVLIHHET